MPQEETFYQYDDEYQGPGAEETEGELSSKLRAANAELGMLVQTLFQYIIYLSQGGAMTRGDKIGNEDF